MIKIKRTNPPKTKMEQDRNKKLNKGTCKCYQIKSLIKKDILLTK